MDDLSATENSRDIALASAHAFADLANELFEALSELARAAGDIERQRSTSGGINSEDWDDLSSTLADAHAALKRSGQVLGDGKALPLEIGDESLREEVERRRAEWVQAGERIKAAEDRADRLEASLKAEIDRNTPLEARMRKALEEIRRVVAVPFDSFDPDMAAELNAGSVIRMTIIARNALLVESSERMHDALGTTPHNGG